MPTRRSPSLVTSTPGNALRYRDKPLATCDTFTLGRPVKLIECLDFMAEQGFFDVNELQEALVVLADDVDVPVRLERAVDVAVGFRLTSE